VDEDVDGDEVLSSEAESDGPSLGTLATRAYRRTLSGVNGEILALQLVVLVANGECRNGMRKLGGPGCASSMMIALESCEEWYRIVWRT
jgi:hypothetical protein